MYLAMLLHENQQVTVGSCHTQEVSLSWADGMIGCIAVFDTREAAEEYSSEAGCEVLEVGYTKK